MLQSVVTESTLPVRPAVGLAGLVTWLKRYRLELMVAAAITAIWFSVLQFRTLMEPDEGRYAEIPREMLAQSDWIVPHLNGIQYLEKPPLQYWATAVGYVLFGVQPWVSRLWSAGLGWLGIGLVYAIGRSVFTQEAGFYAALILASCPLYVAIAQINVLDMGLAFLLTAGLGCLLTAQQVNRTPAHRRRWMWAAWIALALGFLQKGLVAFVLPGLAVTIYLLIERDWSLLRRLHWRSGLLIAALIDLPWVFAISARNPQFPAFFFIHEHFARFTTTIHDRAQPAWFFPAVLLVGVLPWLPAIASGVRHCWNDTGEFRASRFLLIWAATILVFFSLSGSKLAPYIVPMVAPLALLGGQALARHCSHWRLSYLVICPMILAALCLLSVPLIVAFVAPGPRQSAALLSAEWAALGGDLIVAASLGTLVLRRYTSGRSAMHLALSVLSVGLCAALVTLAAGTNSLQAANGGPAIAATMRPHLSEKTPFYCVGMYPQTVIFALARTCTLVSYHGELMPQFDDGEPNWIGSLAEFMNRWQLQPGAVAIVDSQQLAQLAAEGLPAVVLARTEKAVAIIRP